MSRLHSLSLHLQRDFAGDLTRRAYRINTRRINLSAPPHQSRSIFSTSSNILSNKSILKEAFNSGGTYKTSLKECVGYWIHTHEFHSRQSSQRKLSARARRNEYHEFVPRAYRNHNEDKIERRNEPGKHRSKNNSKVRERQSTGSRQRQRYQDKRKEYYNPDDPKKKIISLQKKDVELAIMIEDYEEKLGTVAFFPNSLIDMKENLDFFSRYKSVRKEQKKEWTRKFSFREDGQSSLIQTEEDYKKICITLKQMISKWSTMEAKTSRLVAQCLSSGEHQSGSRVTLSSLPAMNALNYVILLESLRKQRAELINSELDKDRKEHSHASTGLLQWMQDTVKMLTAGNESKNDPNEIRSKDVKDLTAHITPRWTTSRLQYGQILSSFIDSKTLPNGPSDFSTEEAIEAILSLINRSAEEGNPNCSASRKINHFVMKYYLKNPTFENAKKSFDLLMTMIENRKQNLDQLNHPSQYSFHLATITFRYAISRMKRRKDKLEALSYVDNIMDEMEQFDPVWNDKHMNDIEDPISSEDVESDPKYFLEVNSLPYQFVLELIFEIGQKDLKDFFERIDNIMIRMIGEEAHKGLYSDLNVDLPKTIDCRVLSELLHCLSYGNITREHVDKAKVLLYKMQRAQGQSLIDDQSFWDTNYPDHRSYNTVIMGLIHITSRLAENKRLNAIQRNQTEKDAIYATGLLDSMVENESSLPNLTTFFRILRLWGMSNAKDSGERAEEILSRLNVQACSFPNFSNQIDFSLILRLHADALECWLASVNAEYPGAVKRAGLLVERLKSQQQIQMIDLDKVESDDSTSKKGNERMRNVYINLLKCCAQTRLEQDKADAFEIAFDTYNKILDEDITPTHYMFMLLLQCCKFAPSLQMQRNLSLQVFDSASKLGLASEQMNDFMRDMKHDVDYRTISHAG